MWGFAACWQAALACMCGRCLAVCFRCGCRSRCEAFVKCHHGQWVFEFKRADNSYVQIHPLGSAPLSVADKMDRGVTRPGLAEGTGAGWGRGQPRHGWRETGQWWGQGDEQDRWDQNRGSEGHGGEPRHGDGSWNHHHLSDTGASSSSAPGPAISHTAFAPDPAQRPQQQQQEESTQKIGSSAGESQWGQRGAAQEKSGQWRWEVKPDSRHSWSQHATSDSSTPAPRATQDRPPAEADTGQVGKQRSGKWWGAGRETESWFGRDLTEDPTWPSNGHAKTSWGPDLGQSWSHHATWSQAAGKQQGGTEEREQWQWGEGRERWSHLGPSGWDSTQEATSSTSPAQPATHSRPPWPSWEEAQRGAEKGPGQWRQATWRERWSSDGRHSSATSWDAQDFAPSPLAIKATPNPDPAPAPAQGAPHTTPVGLPLISMTTTGQPQEQWGEEESETGSHCRLAIEAIQDDKTTSAIAASGIQQATSAPPTPGAALARASAPGPLATQERQDETDSATIGLASSTLMWPPGLDLPEDQTAGMTSSDWHSTRSTSSVLAPQPGPLATETTQPQDETISAISMDGSSCDVATSAPTGPQGLDATAATTEQAAEPPNSSGASSSCMPGLPASQEAQHETTTDMSISTITTDGFDVVTSMPASVTSTPAPSAITQYARASSPSPRLASQEPPENDRQSTSVQTEAEWNILAELCAPQPSFALGTVFALPCTQRLAHWLIAFVIVSSGAVLLRATV